MENKKINLDDLVDDKFYTSPGDITKTQAKLLTKELLIDFSK